MIPEKFEIEIFERLEGALHAQELDHRLVPSLNPDHEVALAGLLGVDDDVRLRPVRREIFD